MVGEAANGEQAPRLCVELHPDVVVMDMIMLQMDGFTAMQHLRQRHPDIRVIALTSFLDGEFVQRAIQASASGYLLEVTNRTEAVYVAMQRGLVERSAT